MSIPKLLATVVPLRRVLAISLALAACLAAAQTPASTSFNPDNVLARGPANTTITVADVLSEIAHAPEAERKAVLASADTLQQIASNLLVRRVLAAEAQRDGLARDAIVAAALAVARDRILSDARLARLDAQNAPSDAALDAYARGMYQASGTRFDRPAQTHARHILLANTGAESLNKAQEMVAKLRAGASFEELAKANSIDTGSAIRGGDLGFFGAGRMVRPFEDAVNKLAKPGDISDPVESQFGYHIIRLEERREKGRQPYEEVRKQLIDEARTALLNESRVAKVQSMAKDFVMERPAIEAMTKPATN